MLHWIYIFLLQHTLRKTDTDRQTIQKGARIQSRTTRLQGMTATILLYSVGPYGGKGAHTYITQK